MAYFTAPTNTAVNFQTAFSGLTALTDNHTVFGLQTGAGFTAYLSGQAALVVSGTGFTYSGPTPIDGAITTLLLKQGGVTVGTLTGLAIDFSDFVANLANHGVAAAIEQLLSGSDTITGSSLDDVLLGKAGDDVISGLKGDDRLYGDEGKDTLYGGDDDDQLYGGAGNDLLYGGKGDDTIFGVSGVDTIDGGTGVDTVWFTNVQSPLSLTLNGANAADVHVSTILGGSSIGSVANVENVVGGNGNDTIAGDGNRNLISGGNGNDTLSGGGGDDQLLGSTGNDTLHGDAGNDELDGGSGDDILDGGAGADVMSGGSGDDTYIVDYIGDKVIEQAGGGVDTVQSSASLVLGANVENLTLTGVAAVDATGSGLANALVGNAADNRLDGKGGADSMKGGGGDDTYVVDNAGDAVVEGAGQGIDLVISSVSHALGANVENLTLTGAADISGTGNALANAITGNGGDNALSGGLGHDILSGGAGNDTFVFDVKVTRMNADVIDDFSVGDHIGLDADIFGKVNDDGALKAKFFAFGHADDGNDYIVAKKNGKVFYDKDGDGHHHGKLIATVSDHHLDAGDFLIV